MDALVGLERTNALDYSSGAPTDKNQTGAVQIYCEQLPMPTNIQVNTTSHQQTANDPGTESATRKINSWASNAHLPQQAQHYKSISIKSQELSGRDKTQGGGDRSHALGGVHQAIRRGTTDLQGAGIKRGGDLDASHFLHGTASRLNEREAKFGRDLHNSDQRPSKDTRGVSANKSSQEQ